MACLEMFNSDQHQCANLSSSTTPPPMSHRISFSNDFSSDDEIFSKGRILPFKPDTNKSTTTTLRDKLLNDDEDGDDDDNTFSLMSRPPIRWRGFLRMNKSNHILSSKNKYDHHHLSKVSDKGFTIESVIKGNEDEELHVSKIPKEVLKSTADDNIGTTNTRENMEIGI
ncbi:hypothetical protein MKX01_007881 [Papaver californicum]|nr:hypothetical protein MKX01_007881 [Papaver californicum]